MSIQRTILEHTADVGIHISAPDTLAAFQEAGYAVRDLLVETEPIENTQLDEFLLNQQTNSIACSGIDAPSLLVTYLNEFLFRYEVDGLVAYTIHLTSLTSVKLSGTVTWVSPETLGWVPYLGVKAITYYQIQVNIQDGLTVLQFFVDI
jgi:SHS2 domain-containing protein